MTDKKQPICRECHILFSSWNELAKHIVANQETHPSKSVMFAYHVLSEVDNVQEHKPRLPMSPELRQTVKECVRGISGRYQEVRTVCPDCHHATEQQLEVEFIQDDTWRNSLGSFVVLCDKCRNNNYRKHAETYK